MNIKVNQKTAYTFTDWQLKIIEDFYIPEYKEQEIAYIAEYFMKQWVYTLYHDFRQKWLPVLEKENASAPENPDEFVQLITSREDYKNFQQKLNDLPR